MNTQLLTAQPLTARFRLSLRLALVPFVSLGSVLGAQQPAAAASADPLIVHEWGTFTSMQGADGSGLEGLHHEEEKLPDFVYSRSEVQNCKLRKFGFKGLEVPALKPGSGKLRILVAKVSQKMETPVIYVYSARARRLRLRVDFIEGLLTQWYPVSDLLGPPELPAGKGPLDLRKVRRSFLRWDLEVLPRGTRRPALVPEVAAEDPWAYAREVQANWLRTVPRSGMRKGPTEAERYLFYRGLGTFQLPLKIQAQAGGRAALHWGGRAPLPAAVAVELGPRGGRLKFLGAVPQQQARHFDLSPEPWHPPARFKLRLADILHKMLLAEGLYAAEARAMVRTWSRSWFLTPGTRVLYLVPRPQVDRILPLRIEPAPDQLVRVLVGRLEYLSPEVEAAVAADLRNWDAAALPVREQARRRLLALDRFLEPHLRRALARSPDAELQRVGRMLLAQLQR